MAHLLLNVAAATLRPAMHGLLSLTLPILLQVTGTPAAPSPRVLKLDDAVQAAIKNQPAVLQAEAQTRAAAGRANQARSGLLPQVSGTALYQRAHGALRSTTTAAPGVAAAPTTGSYDFFNFGLNASQLIWDFGQTYERTRAANRSTEAFRISERSTELQVLLNVRRAFFQARAQKALIRVAEETMSNHVQHLAQIQGFVTVGTRPEIDLAQARSDIANDRVTLITAQNGYEIAKAQLTQAMGTPGGPAFDVADEELPPILGEDQPIEQLVHTALSGRPELASLERVQDSQQLTIRGLKGGYGPALSAAAGASESGTSLDNLGPAWNVGATLSWPIFQGGLTTGLVHEAEANLDVTHAQLESERLQVRFDVEQGALTVRAAKAQIAAANDALSNARERLRLAEGRYTQGVGSIIELADAQLAAASSASLVVQSEFSLSSARAQLLTALGRR